MRVGGGRAGAGVDGDGVERVLVTLRVRVALRVRGLAGWVTCGCG